ncbi:MAG TPA: hypothetical protein VN310_13180 [Candidatus Dormibacteraeota bacterium]|jgi:hypothetical protein|nr:hypothetical protein [Candidatus Dormibacteraeota bacterium]
MTLRKSILLFIGLGMIAFLVACSSSSHTTPPPTIAITATGGTGQMAVVGVAFANPLVATVTTNGTASGAPSVTFTAPAATNGTFASTGTNTETDTAVAGVATSSVFTAGTAAGTYNVTATTTGATTPATFALTNTAGAVAALAVSSGNNQSATVSAAFASPLAAQVTDGDGNPVATAGISVTFTANTGATGATAGFSGGTNTDTELTDVNGVATTTQTLTANATSGAFTVTASSGALTSANFSLTNNAVVATLGNGNYAFILSGIDIDDYSFFFVNGVFTVSGGVITGGEQDYVDSNNYSNSQTLGGQDLINPTGSSISVTADGNLQIVLTTCLGSTCTSTDSVVGVGGVETINATLRPSNPNRAVIAEFDASGSATGEMRLQDPTAAAATPSLGYAFQVSGFDGGEESATGNLNILNMGGIINVDGAGTISGSGSIFDANDNSSGTLFQGETLQASTGTVSAPDAFGRVVFSITPTDTTDFPQISWVGYIADSSRMYLVETADSYFGTTGGIAYSQGAFTGTFSSASISTGTYGFVGTGFDANGALQAVSAVTFTSLGTVTGFLDFNDLSGSEPASPDAVTAPSYTVDSTGRVTFTLTDAFANSNTVQLYLNGNGQVVGVTMDTLDNLGSNLGGQISPPFSDANFTGNYATVAWGWDFNEFGPFGAVGVSAATGVGDTFSGFADINHFTAGLPTPTTATATNATVSGSYTTSANSGIFTSFVTGLDADSGFTNTDKFNFYQVDPNGTTVGIETDSNQLTLILFQP